MAETEGNAMFSRRKVLIGAPMAAAAAPMAAKEMMKEAAGKEMGTRLGYGYLGQEKSMLSQTESAASNDWVEHEIKQLAFRKKEIQGRTLDFRTYERARFIEAARVDGMKSLSPVSRLRMVTEWEQEREDYREILNIDARLKGLCEEFPVAASMLKAMGVI